MSGHGLQATIDRVKAKNELLRVNLLHDRMKALGIEPLGREAKLLLHDYRPDVSDVEEAYSIEHIHGWLVDQFVEYLADGEATT